MTQNNISKRYKDIKQILDIKHLWTLSASDIYSKEQWAEKISIPFKPNFTYIDLLLRNICIKELNLITDVKYGFCDSSINESEENSFHSIIGTPNSPLLTEETSENFPLKRGKGITIEVNKIYFYITIFSIL